MIYRTADLARQSGLTYRVVDHWIRKGRIGPDLPPVDVGGHQWTRPTRRPGCGLIRRWSEPKFHADLEWLTEWRAWKADRP